METKGLLFHERYNRDLGVQQDVFSVTITGSASEYLETVKSLLKVLGGVDDNMLRHEEVYYICCLIEDMLPTYEQIQIQQDVFSVTITGSASEYLETVKSLLKVLGGVDDNMLRHEEVYYICCLIEDMLPTYEQIQMIEKSQKKQK